MKVPVSLPFWMKVNKHNCNKGKIIASNYEDYYVKKTCFNMSDIFVKLQLVFLNYQKVSFFIVCFYLSQFDEMGLLCRQAGRGVVNNLTNKQFNQSPPRNKKMTGIIPTVRLVHFHNLIPINILPKKCYNKIEENESYNAIKISHTSK